jgi:putative selenate reductase
LQNGRRVSVNPKTGETSISGVYAAGDCVRGPATVVEAIADAKTVVMSILKREGLADDALIDHMYEPASRDRIAENRVRRAGVHFYDPVEKLPLKRRKGFDTVIQTVPNEKAVEESERCLRCSQFCSKCVEVCPNRANVTLFMEPVSTSTISVTSAVIARPSVPFREGPTQSSRHSSRMSRCFQTVKTSASM